VKLFLLLSAKMKLCQIVQFSLSQVLILKFGFNFFAAYTFFCSYTNDFLCVCVNFMEKCQALESGTVPAFVKSF